MYLTEKNWMHRWHPNKKHFLSCDSSPPDGDSTRDLIRCTGLPPRRPGPHPRRHPLFLSAAWRLMKGTLGCRASTQLYSVSFIIRPLRYMSTVIQAFLFLFQHFYELFCIAGSFCLFSGSGSLSYEEIQTILFLHQFL